MLQRIDALGAEFQDGLSSSLRDSGFETLEVRVRDRLGDQDAKIEQHRLHQMAYLEGMSVALRQKHAKALASVQGAKHQETLEECTSAVEQFATTQRDEFRHSAEDHGEKLAEVRKGFAVTVQELDTKLMNVLARSWFVLQPGEPLPCEAHGHKS